MQTYVLEYNPEVVRKLFLRDSAGRPGVYVHNRVQTIFRTARYLGVGASNFRVALGRMKEDDLEKVMWDFLTTNSNVWSVQPLLKAVWTFPMPTP